MISPIDPTSGPRQGVIFRQSLRCRLDEVRAATGAICAFLGSQGASKEEVASCELALVEACNNAIQHTADEVRHLPLEIAAVCDAAELELRLKDNTPGFDFPREVPLPDAVCERGRGIFLIQAVMDSTEYLRGPGGNSLVMRMKRRGCHHPAAAPSSLEDATNRLAEQEKMLGEMARELCFRSETLSAIFRGSADLGRTNNLVEFTDRLLNDLLHITSADWFVFRRLSSDGLRLELFAASAGHPHFGPLTLLPSVSSGSSVEVHAMSLQREVWFGPTNPVSPVDPLRYFGRDSAGLVRPIMLGEERLGTLTVGRNNTVTRFTAAQSEVVNTFTDFLALELVNARLQEQQVNARLVAHELNIARDIQRALLQKSLPQPDGFGVAGFTESARQVGGDFYDVIRLPDGLLLLVVADVMGKGVPAALFAAIFRSLVRAFPEWMDQPARLLGRVNRLLYEELSNVDMFITAQLALFDPRRQRLTVANAGHCPLLVAEAGEPTISRIAPDGIPLGISADGGFVETVIPFKNRICLCLYTDGVTEARNLHGEFFGYGRLTRWLSNAVTGDRPVEELRDQLSDELRRFQGDIALGDDQTFLILAGEPAAPPAEPLEESSHPDYETDSSTLRVH